MPAKVGDKQLDAKTKKVIASFRSYMGEIDRNTSWYAEKFERSEYEKTGPQLLGKPNVDGLIYPDPAIIDPYSYRKILRHPTVALARCLMVAPMTLPDWNVTCEDDAPKGAEELIKREVVAKKESIIKRGLEGCIDFGWIAFENVYAPGKTKDGDDCVRLVAMKDLLHEITLLRANPYTGEFAGVRQNDTWTGVPINLPASKIQLFNIDQRGSNWYGNPMLDNCFEAVKSWELTDKIADRYICKIAGAHWVIHYPTGTTRYQGQDNVDNAKIAADLLDKLQANSGFSIPYDVQEYVEAQNRGSNQPIWKIENFSDSGATSASYTDILKYKETLIVRAFMMPERSILEGQFGTKAESVAQAEAAVSHMEMRLHGLIDQLNRQTVNYLLELNYGSLAKDSVRIETPPITKSNIDFVKDIYSSLLSNGELGYAIASNINSDALGDQLGIPQVPDSEKVDPKEEAQKKEGEQDGHDEPEDDVQENPRKMGRVED